MISAKEVSAKEAIVRFFKRYFDFRGRSTRAEYWWPQLGIIIVFVAAGGLLELLGFDENSSDMGPVEWIVLIPLSIFLIAIVIPSIALLVRRLHDINRSGILVIPIYLLGVLPILGILSFIAFIVIGCVPGTEGSNRYGEPTVA